MKYLLAFIVALTVCAALFLALDVLLFNVQGLSFTFKG
jgi:hypothetical protein